MWPLIELTLLLHVIPHPIYSSLDEKIDAHISHSFTGVIRIQWIRICDGELTILDVSFKSTR